MSVFDGVSRPMRAAGLGLIAVAVVATALGGVSVVTGGDPADTAATGSAEPDPDAGGSDHGDTPDDPGRGADGADSGDGTDDGASGDDGADGGEPGRDAGGDKTGEDADTDRGGTDGDRGDNRQASVEETAVRVYNNSDISGLAADAGDDLRARGWNVVEVANYSDGIIPHSTVYFRPGTDEEQLAHALGEDFDMRVEPRFDGISDASPGLVVIVTRDYDGPVDPK